MNFIQEAMVDNFWKSWEMKFTSRSNYYLDPDDPAVAGEAEDLEIRSSKSGHKIAKEIWKYINDEYKYKLTKEWQKPADLIDSRIGDCEDYCFLLGSLLPHFGVDRYKIITGEAEVRGQREFHVWMRVDDEIIDPTAKVGGIDNIDYDKELQFNIQVQ